MHGESATPRAFYQNKKIVPVDQAVVTAMSLSYRKGTFASNQDWLNINLKNEYTVTLMHHQVCEMQKKEAYLPPYSLMSAPLESCSILLTGQLQCICLLRSLAMCFTKSLSGQSSTR